jgi:hypothetical protein
MAGEKEESRLQRAEVDKTRGEQESMTIFYRDKVLFISFFERVCL